VYFRRHREDKKAGGTGMARLIDADALKKEYRMADRCEDCARNSRDCQNVYSWTLMDVCSMLDEAPTIGGWVSVKDRLPEDGLIGKLICDDNNNVMICDKVTTVTLSNGEKVFSPDSQLVDFIMEGMKVPPDKITHITHWMPLPEPPKEDATSGNH
jgi:hypothetical protein